MAAPRPLLSVMSHLASALMLLAIVARSAVPQGWMPAGNEQGSIGTFTICSVTGTFRLPAGIDGNPLPQEPGNGTKHPPCAFAAMATLSLTGSAVTLPVPALAGVLDTRPKHDVVQGKRPTGTPTARAPPRPQQFA